jgi:hypothetical protein
MREDKKGGLAVMIGMGGMGKGGMDECCEEVMFKAPEGMDVSEMKKGDEKEILAKVKYYGNGQFELISVDGYPIGSAEEEMPEGSEHEMNEGMEEEMPKESYPQKLKSRAGLA